MRCHRNQIKADLFRLQNLFTSLWLSATIRSTVMWQFKCIKLETAHNLKQQHSKLLSLPLFLALHFKPKIDSFSSLTHVDFFYGQKKPNVKCRNMIRKSNLIHEFITYWRHSCRAFIDPFEDIISSRLSLVELLRNYIFFSLLLLDHETALNRS